MSNGQTVHVEARFSHKVTNTVNAIGMHGADYVMAQEKSSTKDAADMVCN